MNTQFPRYCYKCNTPAYEKSDNFCQNCGELLNSSSQNSLNYSYSIKSIKNILYISFNGFVLFFFLNTSKNFSRLFILLTFLPAIILAGNFYIFNLRVKKDLRCILGIGYNIVLFTFTAIFFFLTKITADFFGLFLVLFFFLLFLLGNFLLFNHEPFKVKNLS